MAETWLLNDNNGTKQTDTNRISVDISTLSGWANIASGSHTLTVKAKADGYGTSDASTGVAFDKAGSGET